MLAVRQESDFDKGSRIKQMVKAFACGQFSAVMSFFDIFSTAHFAGLFTLRHKYLYCVVVH